MSVKRSPDRFGGHAVKQRLAGIADAESARQVFEAGVPVANINRLQGVDRDIRGVDKEGPKRRNRHGSGRTKGLRGYTSYTPFESPVAVALTEAFADASQVVLLDEED